MTDLQNQRSSESRLTIILNVRGRVSDPGHCLGQFERRNLVSPPTINFLDSKLTRVMHEGAMTGAQFKIRIDGTSRSYRDQRDIAMQSAGGVVFACACALVTLG